MRRLIPMLIASLTGLVMIAAFFVPAMQGWSRSVESWFTILAAMALLLGAANLFLHHLRKIYRQEAGWGFSALTLSTLVVTIVLGLLKVGVTPSESFPDYSWSGSYQEEGSATWWIYIYVIQPITATMFALLAFYVASAAYRAFRAKTFEAGLLLGTAIIVLLGRSYAGTILTSWLPPSLENLTFSSLTVGIMAVFNTAGQRAIMIGIALGVAATSLRILLGIDRSYLGGED